MWLFKRRVGLELFAELFDIRFGEAARLGIRDGTPEVEHKVVSETEVCQVRAVDLDGEVVRVVLASTRLPNLLGWN